MEQYDARIDAYIEKSAAFAKPILQHIRRVVHEASPLIVENIKWGMPFFEYKGPVCMMAAFKQHCGFGFWKASRLNDPDRFISEGDGEAAAGSFGRIASIDDLPPVDAIKDFIGQLMALNENAKNAHKAPAPKKAPAEKKELVTPDYFAALLGQNSKAKETFDNFSYSHKKEYLEWIIEAKTDATRQKRIDTAIEWMSEGKSRMWKYKAP